ncbi:3-ketoacyl-CoA synthase 19-like [Mercurialis annua]|uniref:3-ketoacyl-CoA synthase 19-like n=1 Tax=Mercurialis annua TaxID=3986 RepID=UPI002160DC28|nr:3-ketoacyl-CoA synthase 19-like [Mercurialis annua]
MTIKSSKLNQTTYCLEKFLDRLCTIINSGIGDETYGPRNILEGREKTPSLADGFSELDEATFDTLDRLFVRTGISPSEIDILVTTVSLFTPVPSVTSRIINRYKMRENVKSFNLSGMGCSGSVVGIDLVQQLFKSHQNKFAIIVSTECMGQNWYSGKEKSMMLSNILFRSGGCSMILTNNRDFKNKAILKLTQIVRTHHGSSDEAYGSCIETEDELGYKGFYLSRSLSKAAGEALTLNLKTLLPKTLPFWEILRYLISSYFRKKSNSESRINLKTGIDHFCVHPGGKAIVDKVGENLRLSKYDVEPTRMALYRFGNTSSGGLWYVLGYMEAKKRLKKGDKILMISLGAGFKCNNCVWKVMKNLEDQNVWKDCIASYPPNMAVNPFVKMQRMNEEFSG